MLGTSRHGDVLRFASLIPRRVAHVQLLDLLEKVRRLGDAPVALEEMPSNRLSTLIHVRRDAIVLKM
jgi:hypothetical protein